MTTSSTRPLSLARTAAALAAAALTVPLLATAAVASGGTGAPAPTERPAPHRVVHQDPAGDVLTFLTEDEAKTPAPGNTTSDITRTVVNHTAKRVVMKVRVRELSRSGYRFTLAEIVTPGKSYNLTTDYSRKPIGSRLDLMTFSNREVSCAGAAWAVDRKARTVTMSVPRSCLGNPRWVKVGLATISAPKDLSYSKADDSRRDGILNDRHLKAGPRQPHA